MAERHECEAMVLANLAWMRRTMASVCRRHGAPPGDVEEFISWAMLKLIEDDYAVLRKFRGESSIRTYLTVVIAMLHREYRVRSWGRWRASAVARRGGPIAVRLEMLVHRDGIPLAQAVVMLRAAGAHELSDRQFAAMYRSFPPRQSRRSIEVHAPGADAAASLGADDLVSLAEAAEERRRIRVALADALDILTIEDRMLVRMRYVDDMTVADIARSLGVPQRPLYRHIARLLAIVRRALESAGLTRRRAISLLTEWVA